MSLDPVPIAPAIFVFDDVSGFGQVAHDAKGSSLSDAERGRDVAKTNPGVVCDADERPGVVRKEAPLRHDTTIAINFRK